MGFKEQVANDLLSAMGNTVFGESIVYNGSTIQNAIITRGAYPTESGINSADYATIMVRKADKSSVLYKDTVQFDGCFWVVESIISSSEFMILFQVRKNESVIYK